MGNLLGVSIDISGLKELRKQFENAEKHAHEFVEDEVKELTALLLIGATDDTPEVTSNMARHWTNHKEGFVTSAPKPRDWVKTQTVNKNGNVYSLDVLNNAEYAPYVEWGHRTKGGKGWVGGQFILTINVARLQKRANGIIKQDLEAFLRKYLK